MSDRPARTAPEAGSAAASAPAARSTRWAPGQSGNPKGRPAGSRNRASLLLEHLIEGEGQAVVQALLAAAKGGDVPAARALLDRLVPPRMLPGEGEALVKLLEAYARTAAAELEERVAALEVRLVGA